MKPLSAALRELLLLTALGAVFFVALNWVASCRCLGTVSDSLADLQDKSLDLVSRLEYRRAGPTPAAEFPPVRLVQLDDATVARHSAGSYLFNRGALADLLEQLDAQTPRAVFIDLDLSLPSNEPLAGSGGPQLSAGDRRLLAVLQRPRSYSLLLGTTAPLSKTTVLGSPATALNLPSVCWVSPVALRDADGRVRRIPTAGPGTLPPAAEVLAGLARGKPCPKVPLEAGGPTITPEVGNRMVLRESELWRGLLPVSGAAVLEGRTPGLFGGALVLVGRTDRASFDTHATPVGPLPGVTVHANQLLTLLTYGRNIQVLNPLVGAPLAFAFTLLALLLTPLLSRWVAARAAGLWARVRRRPVAEASKTNFLERPLMWWSLFLASAVGLHQGGVFLDYLFPILGLELAQVTRQRKLGKLFSQVFKWGMRR